MDSLEQAVQHLKDSAQRIGEGFDSPDADWKGAMFFLAEDGEGVMPLAFKNDEEKAAVANIVVPAAIRKFKPWFVGQVQSAWATEHEHAGREREEVMGASYEDLGILRPSQDPNRIECLILVACTVDQVQMWRAKIVRFKDKPPRLTSWKLWFTGREGEMRGQFITPIIETLKEVHGA